MNWRATASNVTSIDAAAANLLDSLERVRPIRNPHAGPTALGRWLIESNEAGAIGDDTVFWLHALLLPKAA